MSFSKLMTLGQLKALGVKDDRWTVQDKLLMYKGLIRLYNREQKNQVKDTTVLKKKNYKKIAQLRKEVKELHEQVSLVMHGDVSVTRRLLQNHKELQLTYMNMDLDKVVQDLNHRLFCKRKSLNRIQYNKSKQEEQLMKKQIYLEDLKCLISSPDFNRMDLKQQAITNAIQNYDVKFCAAKTIQGVYKRMLAILRQDQRYYEAILVTLQSDSNTQHKCLIRATEMGQLAMEEMANMKTEYTRLEKEVRNNMMDRESNLKEIRDRLIDLREETQGLVRTESEYDLPMIGEILSEEPKRKGKDLETEIRELDEILKRLQEVTLAPKIQSILPSMLQTLRQKRRLLEELRYNAATCEEMLNKKNHAELMFYSLYHSGAEDHQMYDEKYKYYQNQIEAKKAEMEKIRIEQNKVSDKSVRLRSGLQRLCNLLEEIKTPPDFVDEEVNPWPVHNKPESLRPRGEDENDRPAMNEEAQRLIRLIEAKMKFVKIRLRETGDPAEEERAFVSHFKHVCEFMSNNVYPEEDVTEAPALVVDVFIEDAQVPNRTEIKARSQQIYTEATRNPFEVLEPKSKKVAKKKKN